MAETSFQEKTEEPTSKRLSDAREEGNVARSSEFNSVFILLFSFVTLYFLSNKIMSSLSHGFILFYQNMMDFKITDTNAQRFFLLGLNSMVGLILPFLLAIMLAGILVNVLQVGFLFTLKPITPNFKRVDPISGFKKFVSSNSLMELFKSIVKIVILGMITYKTIKSHETDYFLLAQKDLSDIILFIGNLTFNIAMKTTGVLLVLAIVDLIYQKKKYKKDLKMTKQEVKEEMKQVLGDPEVKGRIRSIQLRSAMQRMMDRVEEADVVITNPTHLAVALKYDNENMGAPVVLAKGARLIAEKIKQKAKEHDIPIIENKPLARSLFKLCEVGAEVPFELFQAVAEVFAYVFQLKNKK